VARVAIAMTVRAAPAVRVTSGLSHQLTELDSGLRVVTERMPGVRSVALGFWIGTGSSAETDEQAGLSHLIEHMLFRGTPKYGSQEIDQIFDAMGAEVNAGTGKETTSVYSRMLDEHMPRALDVIADMVWRPSFNDDDLDNERQIVLEEIAMYEDDPQDLVFDILGEAVFGEHPLGRAIIGRADVVAGTPVAGLRAFHAARYVPGAVVVAAAGSVDHDELVALIEAAGVERGGAAVPAPVAPPDEAQERRVKFHVKDTEQYHVCLGSPGLARDDDRRFALRVLDCILGGTSSSRLFQEVREKRGLAYNVYSFQSLFAGSGQVGLYLGTRRDNVGLAMRVVADELGRVRETGVSADELDRARENVKGRVVLSLESTSARMSRLGSSLLADMPVMAIDEVIARIDAVTASDVDDLLGELFDPGRFSAAGIGVDEDVFRESLEPLAELVS
jgi:predicted Zn-dependent peptidase